MNTDLFNERVQILLTPDQGRELTQLLGDIAENEIGQITPEQLEVLLRLIPLLRPQ